MLLKKFSLEKLSIERYALKEKIDAAIDEAIDLAAKNNFARMEKGGLLQTKGEFFEFGDEIALTSVSREPFARHAYEKAEKMNTEELMFANKIDDRANVKWWLRNPQNSGLGIQGWKRDKFYPDFILQTKNGVLILIEYKGAHLIKGEDAEYKKELGKKWAKLSEGDCRFYFVQRRDIDGVVSEIAHL